MPADERGMEQNEGVHGQRQKGAGYSGRQLEGGCLKEPRQQCLQGESSYDK